MFSILDAMLTELTEPELFPGLIYRLVQPRVVLLIFVSGKVVITGAKTEDQLVEGLKKVYPVMLEFRKVNVAPTPGTSAAADTGDSVPTSADAKASKPQTVASVSASGKGKRGGKGKRRGKALQTNVQNPMHKAWLHHDVCTKICGWAEVSLLHLMM